MKQKFQAMEYTSDDSFITSEYEYDGDELGGWEISRNGDSYLKLSSGYKLLKTKACGVCSTDIDRRFLPFPLPQIIGHELIAEDPISKKLYAVEINDTFLARGSNDLDSFCNTGLSSHSPSRMVLGIDRLPGGFGRFILAPKNAMVEIKGIDSNIAVLTEPFAAALQAVTSSPPPENSTVAVLGPRRLGSLLIGALSIYRKSSGKKFKIVSLARHDHLLKLSINLGADQAIDLRKNDENLSKKFDIIYDTTASPQGFETALEFSKKEIHLKSTNGQTVCNIKKMTELVVDEISILPLNENNLSFHWENESRRNEIIYVSPSLIEKVRLDKKFQVFSTNDTSELDKIFNSDIFTNRIPRFDLAIVSNTEEIDFVLRPNPSSEESLLRPRGAILLSGEVFENPFLNFIASGGQLRSSRCGDFHLALKMLEENPELAKNLSKNMISHEYNIKNLEDAFMKAKESNSIKVIVKFDE
jgi:threonine dehydrogenase-like Zn-dependent dehydrogenase